ncbi:MAG: NYN domain-containing protein [Candidatus Nomurabacteria bacterium]|jgi:uncharacterized LabA/DUF88 family protein|nr:NYN domain-containing protein [Candidatus Nomurabacteria bacterium]
MKKTKKPTVYAFIDSQNLNLGVRSQGYKIDWRRFRLYLKNKYNVVEAYLFIGIVPGNQKLYTSLQRAGFILVFKPTVAFIENDKTVVKGNVDAELVLHTMIEFPNYDKAIIVSGDGDFHCLAEYLEEKGKLLRIFTPNRKFSKLLKRFSYCIVIISERMQDSFLIKPKNRDRRSVETLGLPGHGDKTIISNRPASVKRKGGKS